MIEDCQQVVRQRLKHCQRGRERERQFSSEYPGNIRMFSSPSVLMLVEPLEVLLKIDLNLFELQLT